MANLQDIINAFNTPQPSRGLFTSGVAKPGPYQTPLPGLEELKFQNWVTQNQIPFDPGPSSDYDMRGYWQAKNRGEVFQNLNGHYPDTFKTPHHQSFSGESIYANPSLAPHWLGDKLLDRLGSILVDETPSSKGKQGK